MSFFAFFTRQFKLFLLFALCFSNIWAIEYKCRTQFCVKNDTISNIELEKREKVVKFLLDNLPEISELFNNELNKESTSIQIKHFVKKYRITTAFVNLIAQQQPQAFLDVAVNAKAVLNEYCQKHEIDLENLFSKAQKENIQEISLLEFFANSLIKSRIVASTVPTFMTPSQNYLEKFLIPQPGYKVSDIRIVYEEFSVNKNYPNAYSNLLKARSEIMGGKLKRLPKNINSVKETHYHYTSGVNWDMNFQILLFDLSSGNVSTIFEKDNKFCFIKLINYEVLGNDKNLINEVYMYYKALSLSPYSEKFFFDLVNSTHFQDYSENDL